MKRLIAFAIGQNGLDEVVLLLHLENLRKNPEILLLPRLFFTIPLCPFVKRSRFRHFEYIRCARGLSRLGVGLLLSIFFSYLIVFVLRLNSIVTLP